MASNGHSWAVLEPQKAFHWKEEDIPPSGVLRTDMGVKTWLTSHKWSGVRDADAGGRKREGLILTNVAFEPRPSVRRSRDADGEGREGVTRPTAANCAH